MTQFTAPAIDWAALTPMVVVFGAAVTGVLLEAFLPRTARRAVQVPLALVALAAALVAVVWRWTIVQSDGPREVVAGSVIEDGPALAAQAILLIIALVGMLVIADRTETGEGSFVASGSTRPGSEEEERATRAGFSQGEVFPLAMFSILGMMVFTTAGDLLTLFVALEVLSLPLYVLSGLARRRRLLSQEASLKYFLLGSLSSAILLFGSALLYGFAGSVRFADLDDAEVDAYVATGEPQRVAGGFTIDGIGGAYVTTIDGDPFNVVGLSLPIVRQMVIDAGVRWESLWAEHRL